MNLCCSGSPTYLQEGGGHRRRATILAPVSFPAPHRRSGTAPRTRSPNRSLPSPGPAARCWPQSATGAPFYFISNARRCLNGHWPDFQGSEHSLHCLGLHAAAARSFFSPGAADFKSGPNPGPLTGGPDAFCLIFTCIKSRRLDPLLPAEFCRLLSRSLPLPACGLSMPCAVSMFNLHTCRAVPFRRLLPPLPR